MDPVWLFALGWVLWLGLFFVLETAANKLSDRYTLSGYIWWLIGIGEPNPPRWKVWLRRLLIFLMAWLPVHFFTGGWV